MDEVKAIRDKAMALVHYSRQAAPVFLPVDVHGAEAPRARMGSLAHGAYGRVEIVQASSLAMNYPG